MNTLKLTYYLFAVLAILTFSSKGQFILNGAATHNGAGDYLLTPASNGQVGSIWFEDKISLEESFNLDFELYFGTKNGGADGISFCLQPLSTSIGVSGGGLGIKDVNPSFFAEFDTYRNSGDPNFDHVAIQKNGDVLNTGVNNLAPAVRIRNSVDNIEDGQWHPMQVKWDANLKKFDIYVHCVLRVSYSGDIVNSIFGGDPLVYWGFTASTGAANNEHRIRNVRTNLIKLADQEICANGNIQVSLPPTASSFIWSPTTGIDNITSLSPILSPTQTTKYIITYSGFCNTLLKDTFLVKVNSVAGSLGNDTTICDSEILTLDAGTGQDYLWNTNATTKTINTTNNGTYSVKVTHNNGCISNDKIEVTTISCNCADNDNDGVCDEDDLDDDNDGILDEVECPTAQVSTTFETNGGETTSFSAPAADKGFLFNIYKLDNSFNLKVNGLDLVTDQIQCQGTGSADESQLIFTSDQTGYGFGANDNIWVIQGAKESPIIQVNIDALGEVSIMGKRNTGALLEPMMIKSGHPQTQTLIWNSTGTNTVVLSQKVIGPTSISGEGFGVMSCSEDTDSDGVLNYLDTDSDGDGCPDAIEGGGVFKSTDLDGAELSGSVDQNGVPILAGSSGQTVGTSINSAVLGAGCVPPPEAVDTLYVCEGEEVTIEKEDIAIGEWTGKEPFTKLTEGSIQATPTQTTTYYLSSFTKKQNALINGDFEQPFTNTFKIIDDATVTGWNTTASDKKIEFWNDGFLGTPAYEGKQFVELNANMSSALYQDMPTTPETKLIWGFAHRGRNGIDSMYFEVGEPGGPYQKIKTVSTGKYWAFYSGIYEVPAGQTTTRFYYTSAMPGSMGNLLDAIEFYTVEENMDSIVIVVNNTDDIDLGNDTTICFGQSLILDAGSFTSYSWSTNETSKTIEVSEAANYNVEVTTNDDCKVKATIAVDVVPCKTDFINVDTIKICEGETATIISDGVTLETWWSDHSFDEKNKSTITVKPTVGEFLYYIGYSQEYSDSVLVIVYANPKVNLGNDTTICFGEELTLNTKLVGDYIWSTGVTNQQIEVSTTGAYNLQFTDDNGCIANSHINLKVNPLPQVDLGNDTTICAKDEITLEAQNTGLNFNWNTSEKSPTIKVVSAGIYIVEVSDSIGCLSSDSIKIVLQKLPQVDLGNDTTICDNEFVAINAFNDGLIFNWNTGAVSQKIEITTEGVYSVEVTDEIGCLGRDEIKLTVTPLPIVNLGNDTSICAGESVIINTLNPGMNYAWSNGYTSREITINTTGTYEVIVSDEFGCSNSDVISLAVNNIPVVNLGSDTTICKYQSLPLNAGNSRRNFIWNTGAATQKINAEAGSSYSVEVRDEIGCLGTDKIMIYEEVIADPFIEKNKIFCEGNTITLQPDPGYNDYEITWFSNNSSSIINVNATGIYSSLVRSSLCKDTFEINVTKIDTPNAVIVDLQGEKKYCFEFENTWFGIETDNPNNLMIEWDNLVSADELEINAPGVYIAEISNEHCTATYQKKIEEYCKGNLFIPNAFTPNGDDVNDFFLPQSNDHISDYEFKIINRWGVVIFSTTNIKEGWNGRAQNGLVQIDVFVYKINYTYTSKYDGIVQENITGTVSVLR